ncbi:hypothetical protein [Lactobacillus helveticus]|uniref:hypothetical protein n=1 Tax=Lactobacillus helveticus TaxID=1587 RepID=UPI001C654552|nr:hypothetical protein [Lactobacillus helveticus]MBW8009219.1 hypothetical protein [Lactobacillus helveticus]MBW8019260.1 hypothetical protein [Lactobacillus helveticus]MBW8043974.1 hypothetical protein [Lactobacillus helveticus]MBW8053379.1 hypothetical protein [Lactobacillus helveticus]
MKLTDEELDERFVTEISMIIEREIAKEDFESSKTYSYLCSDDPFIEEGPEYFLDLYRNELKYGKMISSATMYFKQKYPEEYQEAGIK